MRRIVAGLVAATLLGACGSPGLRGWYPTDPGSVYGFEFPDGQTVLSKTDDTIGRGTYTVNGTKVLICFGTFCNELTIVGDCLVDDDRGGRYCKEQS